MRAEGPAGAPAPAPEASGGPQLRRVLGGGFAIAAGVGTIIGLGIMRTPGEIAAVVSNPWAYLSLWLLVGLFALMSTAVVAELVSMTPRSGGYYVLVRRAFGPYPGFLMGWIDWVSFLPTIALKVTVMTEFLTLLFPALADWETGIALLTTSIFGGLQLRGVVLGSAVQRFAAAAMAIVLVGMSLALLLAEPVAAAPASSAADRQGLAAWGLVAAAVVFTYDGWLTAAYFGGEILGGGGRVARACVQGVLVVLLLYLGLNAALVFSMPLQRIAGSELALAHALDLAWGEGSGTVVIVAAVLFLLAHQNGNYMTAPRVLYALSLDGLGIQRATTLGRRGNPVFAVALTWLGAVLLILAGGFQFLISLTALFYVVLYLALLVGVFVLRAKEPGETRPYRAWGHPWSTVFGIVGWLSISGFIAWTAPRSAAAALLMTAVSVPVYAWMARWRRRREG